MVQDVKSQSAQNEKWKKMVENGLLIKLRIFIYIIDNEREEEKRKRETRFLEFFRWFFCWFACVFFEEKIEVQIE